MKIEIPSGLRARVIAAVCLAALLLPSAGRADNCDDMYPNEAAGPRRPVLTAGVDANTVRLCRKNQWGIAAFGAANIGYFESSYNTNTGVPNYVAYCLDPDRSARLTGQFWNGVGFSCCNADPDVPPAQQPTRKFLWPGLNNIQFGHMAPQASMQSALDAASRANFFTNGAPQARSVNTGPWKTLETQIRTWDY